MIENNIEMLKDVLLNQRIIMNSLKNILELYSSNSVQETMKLENNIKKNIELLDSRLKKSDN